MTKTKTKECEVCGKEFNCKKKKGRIRLETRDFKGNPKIFWTCSPDCHLKLAKKLKKEWDRKTKQKT